MSSSVTQMYVMSRYLQHVQITSRSRIMQEVYTQMILRIGFENEW
ncbi:MAG: hypothetical protein ACTS8Y_00825 [Arsenophonus sp. ER-EMS1-MAG3]